MLSKNVNNDIKISMNPPIERIHMTSRRPYWCSKTNPVGVGLFSYVKISFVVINLHRCWPLE